MAISCLINPSRTIGTVRPSIFGSFIENLRGCIYGGVYDPDSPVADEDGFRTDVLDAARSMRIDNVRFPGGGFAPFYHWLDGVGPVGRRPRTRYGSMELGGDGAKWPSSNAFGTDEYVRWCRKIGAEPFICVNTGSGSPEEARNWVEYCNAPPGSRWADMRVANGSAEPHGVKWWAIGNEISGEWEFGHCSSAERFVDLAREYARVMKQADPSIRLVLAGNHYAIRRQQRDWNRTVLDKLRAYADVITMHHYVGLMGLWNVSGSDGGQRWDQIGRIETHRRLVESMREFGDGIAQLRGEIELADHLAGKPRGTMIGVTEYGVWYRTWKKGLSERFDLGDALLMACYFANFIRNADVVGLANHAQLVDVLPSIMVEPGGEGSYRQTISFVQELYSQCAGRTSVDCWLDAPTFQGGYYDRVALIEATAVTDDAGKITLHAVNLDHERRHVLEVSIHGRDVEARSARIITGDSLEAANDFGARDQVRIERWDGFRGRSVTLPPSSVVSVEFA